MFSLDYIQHWKFPPMRTNLVELSTYILKEQSKMYAKNSRSSEKTGTDTLIITEALSKIVSKAQEHADVADNSAFEN